MEHLQFLLHSYIGEPGGNKTRFFLSYAKCPPPFIGHEHFVLEHLGKHSQPTRKLGSSDIDATSFVIFSRT